MSGALTRLVGRQVPAGGGAHPLASLFSSQQGGIWDPSYIGTLWQNTAGTTAVTSDGDPVARVDDQSGNANHLLLVGTSGQRPLYKPNSGHPYLLFDGSDDYLKATFTMGTTWDRVSALQVVAFSGGDEAYFGAGGLGSNFISVYGNGSNQLVLQNGVGDGPVISPSVSTDFVMTERWVGASPCTIRQDNGSFINSPSRAGVNPAGVTVGSRRSGSDFSNQRFYGMMMNDGALGSTDLATVVTYMGALQGRSL